MLTGQHQYRYTGTHCPQKGSSLPPDPQKNEFNAPFHLALKTVASALTALMRYEPGLFGLGVWVFLCFLGLLFCTFCFGVWLVSP